MSLVRESYFTERLNPEEHENLEDITTVWFDRAVEQSDDCIDFQSRIRHIINYLVVFNDCTACKNYLISIEQEKIFLIVSGIDGESLVSLVHNLSKINSIYVFCFEKTRHKEWTKSYSKIRGVYENKDELLKIIKNDAFICLHEILPMRALGRKVMQKTIKELNEEGGLFIWSHFLIHILRNMRHDDNATRELLNLSRQHYIGNENELEKISDFEASYNTEKAIWWYTKDSFLYRLLNKALRTENFDVIYKFRSFIADLHHQLKKMHPAYIDGLTLPENEQKLIVYRGQRLAANEFEKLKQNVDGFISMNTFLSTTARSNVALMYSGNGEDRPLFESVLFEIEIEKSYSTEPFADICQASFFQNEDEILFTIGAIFRIDSIDDLTPTISVIKLSLVKYSDEDVGRLTQFLNETIPSEPTIQDLNRIFLRIDDYQRVVRYSKVLLEQTSISDVDRADIYMTLGDAELHINGNYTKAEELFLDAEKIALTLSPCDYKTLVDFYQSMGLLQLEKNNHNGALESFNKALHIVLDHSYKPNTLITIYSNLGLTNRKALNFDQACDNYEKALSIITQVNELPKLHPIRSIILNNLAYTKQLQYRYDEALKYYNLALEIERKTLPANHSVVATTMSNIGLLHMMKDEDEDALTIYEKVVVMLSEIYGGEHPRLGIVFHNLGDVCLRMSRNEQAKEYLSKALRIRLNSNDTDPNDLAATYNSLGIIHCRLQSFSLSLRYLFEALHIRSKIPQTKPNNMPETYMALSRYYLAKSDYCQALRYCELAQFRCQPQTIHLAFVHKRFGEIYSRMGREDEAISHLQTAINIQLQLTNRSNLCLAQLYRDIGILYGCKEESDEALRCFAQVRNLASNNLILTVDSHLATANIYLELKQFDKVLEYLDLAKNISDKIVPRRRSDTAERLSIIGTLYFKKGNFNIALENLTHAVAIIQEESLELQPIACDTYLQLGLTLEKLNKIDEALEVFEKVKAMSLKMYPKSHPLIAPCYHRVSIILRNKNLLEESLRNAEDALTAATTAQPKNYHELARIYDTLSSIYLKRGDINQARIEVQNGSAVRRVHCPGDLPLSQINLANMYIHEDCTQEAIDLLNGITDQQLLSVHNYTPARFSKDIAVIYNNLKQYESALRMIEFALHHIADDEHYLGAEAHFLAACICWTLGHKSQTLRHLNDALNMLDDTTNDSFREMIIHIFKNMTKIYRSLNEYQQALECYQKMLSFCKTDEQARIHLDIGICYAELSEMELSLESCQLAHSLCCSTDYQLLTSIHYELGRCYARNVNSIEALKHFETALDMRLLCVNPDDSPLDSLYQDLGNLYLNTEKYQEAAKFFEKLVERQLEQDDHENAIQTFILLGVTQVQQEAISRAIHYYELGLQLCLNTSSPHYRTAAYIYGHIGEAYDIDCNVWKCVETYAKAVEMASMVEPHDDELSALFLENVQVARQNLIQIERKIFELKETATDEHDETNI